MRLPFSKSQREENTTRAHRLIPGNTVFARADAKVLASLDATIRQAIKTMAKPGVEVGGFLFGELEPWIQISGFEMLEIEHLFDHSAQLSARGLLMFRRVLADRRKQVIGLFRSHTKGEPDIVEADNVIARLFGDLLAVPDPVLLLLPASPAGLEEARLYRKVDTKWVPALRFPLVPQGSGSGITAPSPAATPQQTAREPDREEPAPQPPARAPSARRRLEKKVLWAIVGGVSAAAVMGYFSRHPIAISSSPGLGLAVQQVESGLQVRWNRQSPDVLRAVFGVLTIQDGERRLRIPLAAEQLRRGSIHYIADGPKADIWLEVFRDERHYRSERVTAAAGRPPDLNQKVEPQPALLLDRPVAGVPANPPPEIDLRQPIPLRKPRIVERRKPVEMPVTFTVVGHKPFLQPTAMQRAPNGPADPTGPSLPVPPQISQALPARGPDLPASLPSLPLPPAAVGPQSISYVAAAPVRKVRPAIPANLRAAIQNVVSVEVKVVVDSTGKVVSAAPVAASTTAQKLLAPQAAQAALLWQFDPARRNGVPVNSETLLTFEFERPSR